MIKTAFVAAAIFTAGTGASFALPAALSSGGNPAVEQSNILQVKDNRRHWNRGQHGRSHHRWHRRHHAGPPRGWHRYQSRPWDWQRRGCMAIGPVWFCP